MTRELVRHEQHRERLEYIKRLVTKCNVKKKRYGSLYGSQYLKSGIVWHQTSWKNLTIRCQGELQILSKQREIQRNTDFMM